MSILDVVKNRGSIRKYKAKLVPREDLLRVIEAAQFAQSAANRQPWQFVLVTDAAMKKKLVEASRNQAFVGEAGAVVVCLANPSESARVGPFEGFLIDLAIAIENMALVSWDLGMGSCWIGAFSEQSVKDLLGIPGSLRVVSLLTLGYPDEKPRPKNRKPLGEILHHETYGRRQP